MKVRVPFSTIDFETGEATFQFSQALINSRRWRAGTVEIDISDISVDSSEAVLAPLDTKGGNAHPPTQAAQNVCLSFDEALSLINRGEWALAESKLRELRQTLRASA